MSSIKRYYEDHFDKLVTFESLKESGLSVYEIYLQWDAFSNKSWEEFCGFVH